MTDTKKTARRRLRTFMGPGSHITTMAFDFHPKGLLRIPHLRFKRLWVYIGLSMLLGILALSLISVPPVMVKFLWSDKVMHVVAYAGLMGWFAQIYRHDLARLLLVVGFVAFGVFIEYLQGMTPSRHFDVYDMVANSCGIILAWALSYTILGTILERFESLFFRKRASV